MSIYSYIYNQIHHLTFNHVQYLLIQLLAFFIDMVHFEITYSYLISTQGF